MMMPQKSIRCVNNNPPIIPPPPPPLQFDPVVFQATVSAAVTTALTQIKANGTTGAGTGTN